MGRSLHGHVLIIEDEIVIALDIESSLGALGFRSFDIADSPGRALASAISHPPDLITADIRICGGTGIDAVRAIKAELGDIPVVYVTGNVDLLRDEDPQAIVEKPINAERLATTCLRLCPLPGLD